MFADIDVSGCGANIGMPKNLLKHVDIDGAFAESGCQCSTRRMTGCTDDVRSTVDALHNHHDTMWRKSTTLLTWEKWAFRLCQHPRR